MNETPQTWYRVSDFRWYSAIKVQPVTVVRHTESSVWLERPEAPNESWRTKRISNWEHYYPTLLEVEAFIERTLIRRIEVSEAVIRVETKNIRGAQEQLQTFRQDLHDQFGEP